MLTDLAPAVKKELGITDARQQRLPQPLLLLHLLQNKERGINSKNKDLEKVPEPRHFFHIQTGHCDRENTERSLNCSFRSNIEHNELKLPFYCYISPDYKG